MWRKKPTSICERERLRCLQPAVVQCFLSPNFRHSLITFAHFRHFSRNKLAFFLPAANSLLVQLAEWNIVATRRPPPIDFLKQNKMPTAYSHLITPSSSGPSFWIHSIIPLSSFIHSFARSYSKVKWKLVSVRFVFVHKTKIWYVFIVFFFLHNFWTDAFLVKKNPHIRHSVVVICAVAIHKYNQSAAEKY